jgi:hypothetical protein
VGYDLKVGAGVPAHPNGGLLLWTLAAREQTFQSGERANARPMQLGQPDVYHGNATRRTGTVFFWSAQII